jgi:hypothetical protein
MFQTKFVDEIKTYFIFKNFFLLKKNCAVREIMLKNMAQLGVPQKTIRHMGIECWITKATETHSEYVLLNSFPLQKLMHERVSILL